MQSVLTNTHFYKANLLKLTHTGQYSLNKFYSVLQLTLKEQNLKLMATNICHYINPRA